MKRIVNLLVLALLLNSCDDGNLVLETINFEDATTQICNTNNIIYKLKKKEALLLEIPSNSFVNEPTTIGVPTEITISGSNRVVYRFYNGNVAANNICETIAPATPYVIDQWTATGGTIQITTTAIKTPNPADNSTKISGYNHNVIFKNITFAKANGTQVYETFPFGDYITAATILPFSFDKTLERCTDNTPNTLYNYSGSEALTLEIDPDLITNDVTPLNTPRTGLIGLSTNILKYRLYAGLLTGSYFCNTSIPTTPTISQEWDSVVGVPGISGIIEVTTTTNGTGLKHTIVLKKVTLKKGNSDFTLGDSYIYGELLTN